MKQRITKNMQMSTKIAHLRGSMKRLFRRDLVLLSEQEDQRSTSYYSLSRKSSALRVMSYPSGNQGGSSSFVACTLQSSTLLRPKSKRYGPRADLPTNCLKLNSSHICFSIPPLHCFRWKGGASAHGGSFEFLMIIIPIT